MFPISLKNLNDQERHNYILQTYILNKQKNSETKRYKRDIDVIKEHHRFLWQDEEETTSTTDNISWEQRLARRYYDKLFKEYCIADLTHYKHNKIALRWRVEAEVISGKGHLQCGSRKCELKDDLRTWEVNFGYMEQGVKKNALVKVRLCPLHTEQLNYRSQKREIKRLKKQHKHSKQHTKRRSKEKLEPPAKTERIEEPAEEETVKETTNIVVETEENVWTKKLVIENEQTDREMEFERYLEDLLL